MEKLIHKSHVLESETIDDFARALSLTAHDVKNLKMIFNSVEQGDFGINIYDWEFFLEFVLGKLKH